MSAPELKPCPFCGGEATFGFNFGAEWVECPACEVELARDTFDDAAAAWNRRATDGVRPPDAPSWTELIRAARAVAFSNGFDAAYPENLERLKSILHRLPLPVASGVSASDSETFPHQPPMTGKSR